MPKGFALHWEGTASREDHALCPAQVAEISAFHEATGRGPGPAYNWLYCRHGSQYEAKGWGFVGTAGMVNYANGTTEANRDYWAICYMGGPDDPFTDPAKTAAVRLMAAQPDARDIQPHSTFFATACPGDDIRAWITAGCPAPSQGDDDLTPDEARKLDDLHVALFDQQGRDYLTNFIPKALDEIKASLKGGSAGAGLTEAQVRKVVRDELNKTKLTG